VFGTNGSAEVLDEGTMILRKSGDAPRRLTYPAIDVLRANSTPLPTPSTTSPVPGAGSRRAGDAVSVRGGAGVDEIGFAGRVPRCLRKRPQKELRKSSRYRDIATELQKEIRLASQSRALPTRPN